MIINYSIEAYHPGKHIVHRETFRYLLIINGAGTLRIDEQEYPLSAHSLLELPPGKDVLLENQETGIITIGTMELLDFYVVQTAVRLIPPDQTDMIRKLFLFGLDLEGTEIPRKGAVHNALDHLVFEVITSTGIIVHSVNPAVYHVIDDISQNYRNPNYDYTELINKSGYSVNHFRKLFKDTTHNTPLTFLHVLRVDYAKALMRRYGYNLTLKEISERSGFEDPYYFSRVFKKYEKVSPSDYLRSLENHSEET